MSREEKAGSREEIQEEHACAHCSSSIAVRQLGALLPVPKASKSAQQNTGGWEMAKKNSADICVRTHLINF